MARAARGADPNDGDGYLPAFAFLNLCMECVMTGQSLIWFLLIGLIAGWLAGKIMKGGGFGIVGDIVVGIVGALLGGWVFGMLGIATYGLLGSIITATIGAILLLFIIRLIKSA